MARKLKWLLNEIYYQTKWWLTDRLWDADYYLWEVRDILQETSRCVKRWPAKMRYYAMHLLADGDMVIMNAIVKEDGSLMTKELGDITLLNLDLRHLPSTVALSIKTDGMGRNLGALSLIGNKGHNVYCGKISWQTVYIEPPYTMQETTTYDPNSGDAILARQVWVNRQVSNSFGVPSKYLNEDQQVENDKYDVFAENPGAWPAEDDCPICALTPDTHFGLRPSDETEDEAPERIGIVAFHQRHLV